MRAVVLVLVAVLAGCGVPVPPTLPELEARAGRGDSAAVEALVALLGREAARGDRSEAYRALLRVGEGAGGAVISACGDPDPVRREHALALAANLKRPEAFAEAVRALTDPAFPRRYVGAWVLGEIGDPRGAAHLVRALADEGGGETAKAAARSLVKLGHVAVPLLLEALPGFGGEARNRAIRVFGELGDPRAADALVAALRDPGTRVDAVWSLGKLRRGASAEQLAPHGDDRDWRVRMEVARALGLLGDRGAEPSLERLREGDPVPVVREWAARSLALLSGRPQTYPNARGERVEPDNLYR